jgi:hypothetical protein
VLCIVGPAKQQTEFFDNRVTRRHWCEPRIAAHIGEDLSAALVDPDEARSTVKPDRFEVPKQRMHARRPTPHRSTDGFPETHDAAQVSAVERYLLHTASLPPRDPVQIMALGSQKKCGYNRPWWRLRLFASRIARPF